MADEIDPDAILSLCEITGADPDIARAYLRVADGDMETATQLFFENNGAPLDGGPGPEAAPASRASAARAGDDDDDYEDDDVIPIPVGVSNRQEAEPVRAPMMRTRDTLVGGDGYGSNYDRDHFRSYNAALSNFGGGQASTSRSGANVIPEAFRGLEAESRGGSSRGGGRADRLADIFKAPTDIMFPGDFEQARGRARDMKKWMLVNPQEATEFACQVLNRDLWKEQGVKDFVREHFVFLQFGAQSPEGRKYASFYPFSSYPHIAIIDPRTGERVKTWNTVLDPVQFIHEAMEFLDEHSLDDSRAAPPSRKRKAKNVSEMSEEEQIMAAMQASLAADASKPSSGGGPVIIDDDEGEAIVVDEEDSQVAAEGVDAFESINAVPRPEAPQTADATRIQIRLPDGARIVRRFLKTDPVRQIFEFLKSEVEETKQRRFELNFQKESLINHLDKGIADAGLQNAAINVAWDD